MHVGVSVCPETPVESLGALLDGSLVDLVLVMTVRPGFGGQKFMPDMMGKVRWLRARDAGLCVEVDGGLAPATIDAAAAAGANAVVAGSAVFGSKDPGDVIRQLREAVDRAGSTA